MCLPTHLRSEKLKKKKKKKHSFSLSTPGESTPPSKAKEIHLVAATDFKA